MDQKSTSHRPSRLSVWEPFLLCATALAVLGILGRLSALGLALPGTRPVDLLSDLREPPRGELTDSVPAVLRDTLPDADTAALPPDTSGRILPDLAALDTSGVVAVEGDSSLAPFLDAAASDGPARIAWFGDSFTEGDILVGDLRQFLQRSFGGSGVGLLAATSPVAKFRGDVRQTYSSNWKERNIMAHGGPHLTPGISGRVSLPKLATDSGQASWIQIEPPEGRRQTFHRLRLFVSGGGDSADSVQLRWTGGGTVLWAGAGGMRELVAPLPGVDRVKVSFRVRDSLAVHELELEEESPQVQIDNFSIRGNSGMGLLHIPEANLAAMHGFRSYRLVVLQYGANVADTTMTGYGWYRDRLVEVIQAMKVAFPGAGILVLGVGDRGARGADGRLVSHPSIASIVNAQRQAAQRTGSAFWDMRQAMGGENSMAKWAAQGLCAADYVHISPQGGRRLAKALHKSILLSWSGRRKP